MKKLKELFSKKKGEEKKSFYSEERTPEKLKSKYLMIGITQRMPF